MGVGCGAVSDGCSLSVCVFVDGDGEGGQD